MRHIFIQANIARPIVILSRSCWFRKKKMAICSISNVYVGRQDSTIRINLRKKGGTHFWSVLFVLELYPFRRINSNLNKNSVIHKIATFTQFSVRYKFMKTPTCVLAGYGPRKVLVSRVCCKGHNKVLSI